jgi:hypothetical protein
MVAVVVLLKVCARKDPAPNRKAANEKRRSFFILVRLREGKVIKNKVASKQITSRWFSKVIRFEAVAMVAEQLYV